MGRRRRNRKGGARSHADASPTTAANGHVNDGGCSASPNAVTAAAAAGSPTKQRPRPSEPAPKLEGKPADVEDGKDPGAGEDEGEEAAADDDEAMEDEEPEATEPTDGPEAPKAKDSAESAPAPYQPHARLPEWELQLVISHYFSELNLPYDQLLLRSLDKVKQVGACGHCAPNRCMIHCRYSSEKKQAAMVQCSEAIIARLSLSLSTSLRLLLPNQRQLSVPAALYNAASTAIRVALLCFFCRV